jgi:hypothetical protein
MRMLHTDRMTIWQTCVNGHDLESEGAWLYRLGGARTCRQCAIIATKPAKRNVRL